jgi:N12 class adenine-specific DNA methylase/uncharacterized protein YcbK (DUF882 family)/predicted RNA methylase
MPLFKPLFSNNRPFGIFRGPNAIPGTQPDAMPQIKPANQRAEALATGLTGQEVAQAQPAVADAASRPEPIKVSTQAPKPSGDQHAKQQQRQSTKPLDIPTKDALAEYIVRRAPDFGIDPDIALQVARAEGLNDLTTPENGFRSTIGNEPSFGMYQLLVGGEGTGYGPGLGNAFIEKTGLDPRDPRTSFEQIDFALARARENGWVEWYGARNNGIGRWDGINRNAPIAAMSPERNPRPQIEQASNAFEQLTGDAQRGGNADAVGLARLASPEPEPQGDWGLTFVHAGQDKLTPEFEAILESTSRQMGRPFTINSGYRGPNHPVEARKRTPGQHATGSAADISMRGMSIPERQQLILELRRRGAKRFINYSNSPDMLHVDMKDQTGNGSAWFMFDRSASNMHRAPEWYRDVAQRASSVEVTGVPQNFEQRTSSARSGGTVGLGFEPQDPMGLYRDREVHPMKEAIGLGVPDSALPTPEPRPTRTSDLRPLDIAAGEYLDNGDGTISAEKTITIEDGQGGFMNVPTLFMGPEGLVDLSENPDALQATIAGMQKNGATFERFASQQEAVAAAQARSNDMQRYRLMSPDEFEQWKAEQDQGNSGYFAEGSKALVRGARNVVGTMMQGAATPMSRDPAEETAMAALVRDFERVPQMTDAEWADFQKRAATDIRGRRGVDLVARARTVRNGQMTAAEAIAGLDLERLMPSTNIQDEPLYRSGEAVKQWGEEYLKVAPGWEESWTVAIGEGLGSTAPFLAAGVLPGGAGLAAGTVMGSFASTGEAIDRAIAAGATQEQIMEAARLGRFPGLTEQIPIELLFERVPLPAAGKLATAMGRVLTQAAVEGGQEAVQQAAQNLISRFVYDPDQDLTEGVAEAAGIGAIVGGTLSVGVQGGKEIVDRVTAEPSTDPQSPAPDQPQPPQPADPQPADPQGAVTAPPPADEPPLPGQKPGEAPKGPLSRATQIGLERASRDNAARAEQLGLTPNTSVVVDVPGVDTFMGRIESIEDGEAVVFDTGTGEVLQVPFENITPLMEPSSPEPAPALVPPLPEPREVGPPPGASIGEPVPAKPVITPRRDAQADEPPEFPPLPEPQEVGPPPGSTIGEPGPEPGQPLLDGTPGLEGTPMPPAPAEVAAGVGTADPRADGADGQASRPSGVPEAAAEQRRKADDGTDITLPDLGSAAVFDLGGKLRLGSDSSLPMSRIMEITRDDRQTVADRLQIRAEKVNDLARDYYRRAIAAGRQGKPADAINPKLLERLRSEAAAAPTLDLDAQANQAATSPTNALPEPTQAQKEAGNYKVGRMRLGGFDVSIENPAGSTRSGTSPDGSTWSNEMKSHYGYFRGTVGRDKDHIDTFIKPGTTEVADDAPLFVIDQVDKDGSFDEHKVMTGFASKDEARAAYLENYDDGWDGLGAMTETTVGEFREWTKTADTTKPFGGKRLTKPGDIPPPPSGQAGPGPLAEPGAAQPGQSDQTAGTVEKFIPADKLSRPNQRLLASRRDTPAGDTLGELDRLARLAAGEMNRKGGTLDAMDEAASTGEGPGGQEASVVRRALDLMSAILDDMREKKADTLDDLDPDLVADVRQFIEDDYYAMGMPASGFEADSYDGSARPERMDADKVFPAPRKTVGIDTEAKGTFISEAEAARRLQAWKDAAKEVGKSGKNANKAIVSLFDYTGAWAQPWRDAGYQVILHDIKSDGDILADDYIWNQLEEMRQSGIEVVGVLSACPCTTFAGSGARWWEGLHDKKSKQAVRKVFGARAVASGAESPKAYNLMLVEATKNYVEAAAPTRFHVLENPIGRIQREAGLPKPTARFQPHNFGDPYTKRTQLFGDFDPDMPLANVDPVEGSKMQAKLRGDDAEGKEQRSTTPEGFAYAFFVANDPDAKAMVEREAQADEEAFEVRLTETGPWDFNDTYPMPDDELYRRLDAEGRGMFDNDDGPRDPDQVGQVLEETMQDMVIRRLDIAAAKREIADIDAGKAKLGRKNPEKVKKGLRESIAEDEAALSDLVGALGDVWSEPAVNAIARETARRARQEIGQTDQNATVRKPKAARADEPDRKPRRDASDAVVRPAPQSGEKPGETLTEAEDTPAPADRFAGNKIFTADRVEAARARLKDKMGRLNSGIDPELLVDGITIAGAYVEAGVRDFSRFAKQMTADFGDQVRPYLLSFWEGVRAYPGLDTEGMTSPEESAQLFAEMNSEGMRSTETDTIGTEAKKPAKRSPKRGRPEDLTITDDWGLAHIDAYTGEGEQVKAAFLKEATGYLRAAADILIRAGFQPTTNAKGRQMKPVSKNEAGIAVSGNVSLHLQDPDTGQHIYAHISGGSLRGVVPTTASGVQIMYRIGAVDFATDGANNWAPTTLTAGELADKMLELARGSKPDQSRPPMEASNEPEQLEAPGTRSLEREPAGDGGRSRKGRDAGSDAGRGGQTDLFGSDGAGRSGDSAGRGVADGAREPSVPAADGTDRGSGRANEQQRDPDGAGSERARGESTGRPGLSGANPAQGLTTAATPAQDQPSGYTITDEDALGEGGQKAKFRANIEAIQLLRKLDAEDRAATRSEQKALAKWVGWGGLRDAFPRQDGSVAKGWEKQAAELRDFLSDDEYRAAESSTRNAHFTSPEVVRAMWGAVDRLGFNGGRVLEPSVGSGNFLGLMPADKRTAAQITGVELDHITGGIAKNLYPSANIQAPVGFQAIPIPDNTFDLVIGNPPFGSERVYDAERRNLNSFSIHNFFFAKSIDATKPDGVVAMVVSNFLMDAKASKAREYLADRAELLGAIRLPNNAFLKNAGTEVTTDIVFLRKRRADETPGDRSWTEVGEFTDEEGRTLLLNRYFLDNPSMMLGKFGAYGEMYQGETAALIAREGDDLGALLKEAVAKLPAGVMGEPTHLVTETVEVPDNARSALVGSVFMDDKGDIWVRDPDSIGEAQASKPEFPNAKAEERVRGMIRVRDAFMKLRRAQLNEDATDKQLDKLRGDLNKFYDAFTRKNGPINLDANKRLMRDDPTWPQLSALEKSFDKGLSPAMAKKTGETARKPSAEKADIFTRRTQTPYRRPTSASSARDALTTVMSEYGRVDMAEMVRLYGQPEETIVDELGPLLFKKPDGGYETADAYLSGNVKAKLAQARDAAQKDRSLARNITALEQVIPDDIEPVDIDVKPGAPWLPAEHVGHFIDHIVGTTGNRAIYSKANAKWEVRAESVTAAAENQWGTDRARSVKLLGAALDGKTVQIYDRLNDGSSVLNQPATQAANDKIEQIKDEWRRWVWTDESRRETLARIYNDTFNTDVVRSFDGGHLKLPGKVGDDVIDLRPHQKNFVWRVLQSRTTLADHTVGAGKTFAAITAAMELRRTKMASKPVFVVPNHLVGQWAADFVKLYPSARILAPAKKDFEAANRKRLFARMATGDYDAIIVAHSSFGKIGLDPAFEAEFLQEQISALEESEKLLRAESGQKSRNVSQLAKWRENIEAKLKRLLDAGAKDEGLTFNEIGIDALFVDEAHEFKNLAFPTSMTRVAGLGDPTGSQKAADLYMKVRAVKKRTGGRNIVFLTGTPISNTMAEMYTMQRYLDGEALETLGVAHFDAWAKQFGEIVTDWELSPSGKYKLNSRFAKFVNIPELMQRYLSFADVITNDDIKAMLAAQGKRLPLPAIKGGKPQNVVVQRSDDQAEYLGVPTTDENGVETYPPGSLVWRAENLPKGKPEKGADNMLKVMSDARKAALDMRLIDAAYGDDPASKVHRSADEMVRLYKAWEAERGTQLVFIDLSTPGGAKAKEAARVKALIDKAEAGDSAAQEQVDKMSPDELDAIDGTFSVYDDLRQKLIDRGIPGSEIAFIHDANTDLQKEELFGRVRSGRVRFLFGSTPKMGAGTNVQNRLVGLHHLDAPWRPSDLEQREGRIIRQGNELYAADPDGFEIEILRYATKQTLDSRMWQTIEGKARFIEQLRKGATGERIIEDIGGEAANAAEMKAASSGNPLILEEMDLRQKVRRLSNQEVEHDRSQHRVMSTIRQLSLTADSIRKTIPAWEVDAKSAAAALEQPATIGGATLEKPGEIGSAILEEAQTLGTEPRIIGKWGDFTLSIEGSTDPRFPSMIAINVEGAEVSSVFVDDVQTASGVGTGTKVRNLLQQLTSKPQRRARDLTDAETQLPQLEKQIGPFAKADELAEARQKHREVIEKLKPADKPKQEPETPPEGAETSVPDGVTEFREPLSAAEIAEIDTIIRDVAGLEEVAYVGSIRVTSGVPGWGSTGFTTAAGFYLPAADTITLALDSATPRTAYHEAFHRLQNLFMTDAERKMLRDDAGKLRRIVAGAPGRADAAPRMSQKEIEAEAFAIYAAGEAKAKPYKGIRAVWDKIARVLDRTRNWLKGKGWSTVEDVFDVARSGQMARRAPRQGEGSASFSVADARAPRTAGIPREAVSINRFRNDNPFKAHPDYKAAKAGDPDAAMRLVADLVNDDMLGAAEQLGADVVYVPVHAEEQSGRNQIPNALAVQLANRAGAAIDDEIVQVNRAHHTGAKPMERIMVRPQFDGPVQPRRHVIVDDVSVMASTIAELANHIQAGGGEVVGIATLVNASREGVFLPKRNDVNKLKERFGDQLTQNLGIDAGALTADEARYILGFRNADELGNRLAKARQERIDRLHARSAQFSLPDGPQDAKGRISEGRIIGWLKGKLTDLKPAALGAIVLNYFSELKRPNMTAVDDYLRVKRMMDAFRGDQHAKSHEIAERWLKYNRLGAGKRGKRRAAEIAALMHDTTLAGVDPSKRKPDNIDAATYNELRERYDALPPAGRKLYRDVRDAYEEQQKQLDDILLDNVRKANDIAQRAAEKQYKAEIEAIKKNGKLSTKERADRLEMAKLRYEGASTRAQMSRKARLTRLRIALESSRVQPPYFPLSRFGKYFVTVKDIDGDVISFSRRESAYERDRLAKEMQKAYPQAEVSVGVLEDNASLRDQMDPRLVAEIEQILGGSGMDSGTMAEITDQIWQRYLDTMPDMSIRKRFIHRKGTPGFNEDALRNYSSHMFHASHQMARLKYGMELQELVNDTAAQAKEADDPTSGMILANELRKRHDWVMNPTGGRVAQTMNSAAFVWFLGLTPAAAAVNLSQTPMLGIPMLGARFGSATKAGAAILKASRDSVLGRGLPSRANLTADERQAMDAFYESGLVDRTQSHDLAGVGDTGVNYSPLRAKVMEYIAFLFHSAEVWNREVTALAAYRMAKASGQRQMEAIDTAHDLTWKVHFDYSNSSRPRYLQNDWMKAIMVFRSHNINMLYRLFRDAHQTFKGETPAARREARKQLIGILGMQALFAGTAGIAGFNLAMAVAGMVFGDDDDPMDFEQHVRADIIEMLGPELGGVLLNGAPGHYLGINLTDRIGMPDLWFRSPTRDLQGKDEFDYWVLNSLGATISAIGNGWRGISLVGEGDVYKGVEAMVPKAARDVMRAWRYAQEGVTDYRGNVVVPPGELDTFDIAMQFSGFTPAEVNEAWDRHSALKNAESRINRRRQKLIGAYALAHRLGDDDGKREAMERIKAFNHVDIHKPLAITADTLRRSIRTRARNERRRVDGTLIQNEALGRKLREQLPERVY